jgi:hypothetical protein
MPMAALRIGLDFITLQLRSKVDFATEPHLLGVKSDGTWAEDAQSIN